MRTFLSALFLFAFAQPVLAAKLALVIGNSEYTYLEDLRNPVTDGEGYRDALTELGYDVSFHTDLDRFGMEDAIIDFADRIRDGDEAFVVFSGHGWSDGSVNYLLATDSPLSGSERKLKRYSFALKNGYDGLLDELAIQGARLQVAVVDACRDNPFKPPEGAKSLGLGRGLSRVQPPEGAFVIFSAGAGQVALDRLPSDKAEERFSVFTRHFLPLLNSGLTLEDAVSVAQTQTAELAAQVGHRQSPSYYDETLGKTCLADSCHDLIELAALNAAKPSQCDLLYEEAKTLDGCFAFESYLANCADHAFASIAESYVARQCTQVEAEPEPDPEELARIAKVQRCDGLYTEAKSLGECYAYESFAAQCSDHKFTGLAQSFLQSQCKAPDQEVAVIDPSEQAVRKCDALVASPFDFNRPQTVSGIAFEDIETGLAIESCRNANTLQPEVPRTSFSLARALEAADEDTEAAAFYRVAAAQGYAAAHSALGRFARDGKGGVQRNFDQAIQRFTVAADQGDAAAMVHLAKLFSGEAGLPRQDYAKATDWLRRAASLDYPHAHRALAEAYESGTLFLKDPKKSIEHYLRAASLGDTRSHYEVALLYLQGEEGLMERDPAKAIEHLIQAAKAGEVIAMGRLGKLYHFGAGDGSDLQTDIKEALRWYAMAAENGQVAAQISLGGIFENGVSGVAVNKAEALRWYELAAKQSFTQGLVKTAEMYETGEGTEPNPKKAAQYWVRAVEIGSLVPRHRDDWDRATAREIQRLLREKGTYSGPLDGAIGKGSKEAMRVLSADYHRLDRYNDTQDVIQRVSYGWNCQC